MVCQDYMRILLLTPPMTQLNTPYPATAYLTGFLRHHPGTRHHQVTQADPAMELILKLFSRQGLQRIHSALPDVPKSQLSPAVRNFKARPELYFSTIDAAIRFLQGRDPSLALRISSREFLPEGPRFRATSEFRLETGDPADAGGGDAGGGDAGGGDELSWAFGSLGMQDRAKYLASLYLDDLADVIREGIDSRFELSRYGEKLAASAPTFDPIVAALNAKPTLVDQMLDEITLELLTEHQPEVIGMTAPFPGNVYGAFRIAKLVKERSPSTKIILGGGYVNTELRSLKETRVFDHLDYLVLDDGERPLLCLLEHLEGKRTSEQLLRTFVLENGAVVLKSDSREHDIPQKEVGIPTYDGLKLSHYLSVFEMLNPMHRIWSDGRWNKLTLAHGCYWKKCNFCDINLDYIGRYDPSSVDLIIDRMESLIRETGQSGFHFVDEAAPPAVLRNLALRLIERNVTITWWGNVRFEKTFDAEFAELLARSGCVAVSGGLEVASDRLLKLMNKGVTVEQVARVTNAFTQAGIMVHAYLMFGFPTQTTQETIDALERVRQLFAAGCIQSGFWHRFSATAHSPIGRDPSKYGIEIMPEPEVLFARNDLPFRDPTPTDHAGLGTGLKRALYNYMHGLGLDEDVRFWFETKVPGAKVRADLVESALTQNQKVMKTSS
ncbi:MAG: radical SAM protein [Methylotenera sp.]|nr:radical SAM protein [Oligoflexia bacterium]